MSDDKGWPNRLMLRDTGINDDHGGGGQRIYTTAGQGYKRVSYIRADLWDDLVAATKNLLLRDQQNTCPHENTHRGGAIWEICDDCGAQWADDRGGKPEWKDPPEWDAVRNAINGLERDEPDSFKEEFKAQKGMVDPRLGLLGEKAPSPDREKIVAAALMVDGFTVSLPQPARHGQLFMIIEPTIDITKAVILQGFLTSTGRFVSRVEAKHIAHRAGQPILRERPHEREAFSEDFW